MMIRVEFNQERGRPKEVVEMPSIPDPSSIYALDLSGVRYQVTAIEQFVPPDDGIDAEIRVSKKTGGTRREA